MQVSGQFRVEPAGLTHAGSRLSATADELAAVDLSGPLSAVSSALPGARTASAAAEVAVELEGIVGRLRSAVSAMSATAQASAGNYTGADALQASAFSSGTAGLTGSSSGHIGGGSW